MRRSSSLAAIAFAVVLGSCNSTDLPTAPNLQPVLQAYANPTAEVDGAIMGEVADEIAQAADEIQDSEIFEEILDLIIDVQMELENSTAKACSGGANDGSACTDDAECPDGTCVGTGDVVLGATCSGGSNEGGECATDADCPDEGKCGGGVTLPSPTGAVRFNYICPGWDPQQFDDGYDDSPDPANGSIDLFMTLDSGGIGRVVWGTAANCLYLVPPPEDSNCEAAGCPQASYDGAVALDLGPDWVSEDIEQLPVTFVVEGTIGFAGEPFDINQSFRVVLADESGLLILVDISDPALSQPPLSQTFNYIFGETSQGISAANGEFMCSLEQSRCFDENGTTLFSW